MMGRPTTFDRDEAIDRALHLFWAQGYDTTGLRELLDYLNVSRYSLYEAFGSKEALFVEALQRYDRQSLGQVQALLESTPSPLEGIRTLVRMWEVRIFDASFQGCMINSTATRPGPRPDIVSDIVRTHLVRLSGLIQTNLDRAVTAEELPRETDTKALADFLTNTFEGLLAFGKAGMDADAVQNVIRVTLSMLGR